MSSTALAPYTPGFRGGDPSAAGKKGGPNRAARLSPERRSEIARQGAIALRLKHKKQLLSLVGPAIESLEHALSIAQEDPSALVKVVTAILDRTGFHGKSGIELEGEIDHSHSGEIIHRHQLLDVDHIPLTLKRMIAASLDGWEMPSELEQQIREALPMLQVQVESQREKK